MLQQSLNLPRAKKFLILMAVLVFLVGILYGCQQVHVLEVKMTPEGLVFTNKIIEKGLTENKRYLLLNLGVTREIPCDNPSGCGMWEIVRPTLDVDDATLLKPPNLLSLPIQYGQPLPGMEVKEGPLPLIPERYSVYAVVEGSSDGVKIDILLKLASHFIIKKNAQGQLEVEEVDSN